MIQRAEPVMLEMEREGESLVIVSHQAVLRVILGCAPARGGGWAPARSATPRTPRRRAPPPTAAAPRTRPHP
jgi:broad specificity phosphatase PhoE